MATTLFKFIQDHNLVPTERPYTTSC